MRRAALASALAVLLVGPACGGNSNTTTSASPVFQEAPDPTSRLFTGTLPQKGSAFFSYTTQRAGVATAMLASLTANGRPITAAIGLGIGVPEGTDCAVTTTVTAAPALTPQASNPGLPGTYCVRVSDPGTLPSSVTFGVRITYP